MQTCFFLVGAAHICGCSIVNNHCAASIDDSSGEIVATSAQRLLQAVQANRADVVAILTSRGIKEQLCTGTVLLPNLVLTARHCITTERAAMGSTECDTARVVDPDPSTRVVVVAGKDVDLVPEDAELPVREFLLPEDEGKLCGQDIALLRLEKPLTDTPVVVPGAAQANATFSAVGYGIFDGDWGQQRETPNAQFVCDGLGCSDSRVVANEFLAKSGACEGDSGGPAFDAQGVQFGIASRSTADCSETAYLNLAGYLPWLAVAATYAAQADGYELPTWAQTHENGTVPTSSPTAPERVTHLSARGGCSLVQNARGATGVNAFDLALLAALFVLVRRARPV